MQLRLLVSAAAAAGVFVAGCASATAPATTGSPSATASAKASAAATSTASPKPSKPGSEVTLTGTVEQVQIEGGCLILRVDSNKVFELQGGDPAVIKAGARVTVRGIIRTDLVTICQMGPVLEVRSSQPA